VHIEQWAHCLFSLNWSGRRWTQPNKSLDFQKQLWRSRNSMFTNNETSNIAFIYQMIAVNYMWKHHVFAYPKREHYCFNMFCFEMARQITLSTELSWQTKLARYFKIEPTVIVPFSFGISENTVFSNVIDSYHLVDEHYMSDFFADRRAWDWGDFYPRVHAVYRRVYILLCCCWCCCGDL
jgi:hypothetical protein